MEEEECVVSKERRELLVRVGQLRYGSGLTQQRIGEKLEPRRNQSTIAKLLEEALDSGVVRYEIDADAAITGKEDPALSDDLCKAFGLDTAHAIEVANGSDADEVHVALANYTAGIVRNSLRSYDHLAAAGGRPSPSACDALPQQP